MDDILSKDYASFIEETLRNMTTLPVEGIYIITRLKDGAVFTSSFNSTMMDKITYAGVIQQEAMVDMLKNSGLIRPSEGD